RQDEVGEEIRVVAYPRLLRDVDRHRPAQGVPGNQGIAGDPGRVCAAVGEAAVFPAPRTGAPGAGPVNGKRQRVAQPALRLGNVAGEHRGQGREVGQRDVAVGIVGMDGDARAATNDVVVHVATASQYRGAQLVFWVGVQPGGQPVVGD